MKTRIGLAPRAADWIPRPFFATLLALLVLTAAANGQTTGGAVIGRVSDEHDRFMPGVAITVTRARTGLTRTIKTGLDGRYRFPDLPAGLYELMAEEHGYATVSVRKIDVILGVPRRVDVRMRQVAEDEQVTVTAPVRVVESAPPIGIVVPREIIANVPLRVRDVGEFAALAPLADPRLVHPLAETILDGTTATTDLPLDAVEQINATTRQYPAEYGRTSGGVLLVASRNGQDEFAGDAFGLFRDRSHDWQWGASAGGPLAKDVAHFFVAADRSPSAVQRMFATANGDVSSRHFISGDYAAAKNNSGSVLARDLWLAHETVWNQLVLRGASNANELRDSVAGSFAGPIVRHDWTAGGMALEHGGTSWFAQDQIIAGKVAVNAGLRYDRFTNLHAISPRFGVTYDINGSGRNLIRGSFGRYLNPKETDTSLGYSWQVNPWVALNVDALHSAAAGRRVDPNDAIAVSGFVQFSSYVSFTGSYTYSERVVATNLARHSAVVAGTVHLPAGFWLSGIGRYRSAVIDAERLSGTDVRVAKTFAFDRWGFDVLVDVFNVFAQRAGVVNDRRAGQLGLRVNF